jgi:hypothetical protein
MRGQFLAALLAALGTGNANPGEIHEASMNFDLARVRPFIARLEQRLALGLNVERLSQFAAMTRVDQDRSMTVAVDFAGKKTPLVFRVFMDDIDASDLHFATPSAPLAEVIDRELAAFAEENGL